MGHVVHLSHYVVLTGSLHMTPPTFREAHHRQLLVPVGVDRHQVRGLSVQNVPPETGRPVRPHDTGRPHRPP